MRLTILCLFYLFFLTPLSAQLEHVIVSGIEIQGNKKTKKHIILREMDFSVGDTLFIIDLQDRLEKNRKYVMNTALFNWSTINIKEWDSETNHIKIFIELQEAWYLYPFPIFELADRNFNVWWEEQNRSLKRVNYGIRISHLNTTGHKDPLKLVIHGGYTQKYELNYLLPPLNKDQTFGVIADLFYARNREIAYKTVDNKLLFENRENEYPLQRFRAGFNLFYRPKLKSFHYGKIEFQQNTITDYVIAELNSNYFLNNKTRQRLFFLRYEYAFENRDIKPYPLTGNYFSVVVEKEGLGIFKERNGLYLTGKYAQYFTFGEKWSTEFITKGKTALIREMQPYNNYFALGYLEDYIRGYEFYVIDGLDYIYFKTSLRFQLFDKKVNWGKFMPLKTFRKMPIRIYLSLNNDTGYVNDNQYPELNPLGNIWLWGGGLGLDIILFHDKVLQIEYSMNHLKEKGLFLHYKLSFY